MNDMADRRKPIRKAAGAAKRGRGRLGSRKSKGSCGDSLSAFLQAMSIPAFVIDADRTVTHWNRACENLTGVSAGEVIGTKNAWTAFYPQERPVIAEMVVDQRPREEIAGLYGRGYRESPTLPGAHEVEAFFPHFGAGGKWLFFTAAPVRDGDGQIVGAIETFQDITERVNAERALRESEERLHTILASVHAGIAVLDADSHVILQANPAALAMFGAPESEVVGRECHQYICPAEKGRCPVTDLGVSVDSSERVVLNVQRGSVPVLKTVTSMLLNGRRCLLETFVDITERKQAEAELQRRVLEVSEAKERMEILVSNTADREKRMVDLKREVNALLQALGRAPKYHAPQRIAEMMARSTEPAGG